MSQIILLLEWERYNIELEWMDSKWLISSVQEKTHSISPLASGGLHTLGHPVCSSSAFLQYTFIYKRRNIGGNVVVDSFCFLGERGLSLLKPGKQCVIHVLITTECFQGPENIQSRDTLFRTVLSSPRMALYMGCTQTACFHLLLLHSRSQRPALGVFQRSCSLKPIF